MDRIVCCSLSRSLSGLGTDVVTGEKSAVGPDGSCPESVEGRGPLSLRLTRPATHVDLRFLWRLGAEAGQGKGGRCEINPSLSCLHPMWEKLKWDF